MNEWTSRLTFQIHNANDKEREGEREREGTREKHE